MFIKRNEWKLDLSLEGGRIVSLKKADKYILNTFDRGNGKIGRTHLCVPNFNKEFPEYDLPAHGPSRDRLWKPVLCDSGKFAEIIYKMINEGKYPTDLEISQYFELGEDFIHKMKIVNVGKQEAWVNLAVHYYFKLNPKKLVIDHKNVSDLVANDRGEMEVNELSTISDGDMVIKMDLSGFPQRQVHLWSGSSDSCCIEPVMGARKIKPGQEILGEIRLQSQ